MKRKEKEEERIERIIRALLKLPENRRCINCNSLGPQYVCTTFLTFVCTNCSGVHRDFTHRVKSVSMAKFSAEEVSALQAGGNERARQIYLKEWDPQRNSYPDGSNLHRLRDFIKHVYVDRKYTGERSQDKLARLRLSDKEESYESSKASTYRSGSRSPNHEERHEWSERYGSGGKSDDKSLKYYYDERRSPRYSQENSRYGGFKKRPARFEVVDDRFRDDGTQGGRQSDNRRFSHRESRHESRSPEHQQNMDRSSSPVVRPVKDILGENVPSLQVGKHSKATDGKDVNISARIQKVKSSESVAPIDKNLGENKIQSSESLIDFDSGFKPSDAAAAPQIQGRHPSSDGGNCSSNESSVEESKPPPPKPNTLEFLLFELSVPTVVPAGKVTEVPRNENISSTASSGGVSAAAPPVQILALPDICDASITASGGNVTQDGAPSAITVGQMLALPDISGVSSTASGGNTLLQVVPSSASEGLTSIPNPVGASMMTTETKGSMQADGISPDVTPGQTLTLLDSFDAATTQETVNISDPNIKIPHGQQESSMQQNQPSSIPALWTSVNETTAEGPPSAPAKSSSLDALKPTQDSNPEFKSESLPVGTNCSTRMELPEDLFTVSFLPGPRPIRTGWQTAPPYVMGFNMQYYPNAMPGVTYPNQAKSTNPFDLNNSAASGGQSFPSMGNLLEAFPNVSAPGALLRTSSFGSNSSGFRTTQSSAYESMTPSQSPSYASAMPSGAYQGQQQVHMAMPPPGAQGAGGFGNDPFTSSFLPSKGGNPFG